MLENSNDLLKKVKTSTTADNLKLWLTTFF